MKPYQETHFTIIGLGNLMEVIWHCLTDALGGPTLAQRAVATTADADDLERKRTRFGVPVRLGENLAALERNRPDIIFFAPPPKVAPGVMDADLVPYFHQARAHGWALPEIYAFPPMPPARRYQELLGDDVLVANIIPNNVSQVAGVPVLDEGYYVVSYPTPWPSASRERLQVIFASQGAYVEVPPEQLVPMLGGTCTIFSLWQLVPVLADILTQTGHQVSHNLVGQHLRAQVRLRTGFQPAHSLAAPLPAALPAAVGAYLNLVAGAWYQGVADFYRDIAFPEAATRTILARGFDLILHTTQAENRQVLDGHAIGAATKGGVLEKAIATFHTLVRPTLASGAALLGRGVPDQAWGDTLADQVRQTAHVVKEHGLTLAG